MELHESSQVVKNLLRKRDLLLQGDRAHEEIRSALVICGGAMRGVFGAGAAIAFHRLGLASCFDVVVGISTGAAIASYFLAGEERGLLGTSIYYEECLNGFISFRKWPVADIDYIERTMRHGRKKLDIEAILAHRSQFYVGATDWDSGEGHFLDVKRAKPDPLAAIKASFAITELYRRPVVVNGKRFTDGSTAMPFPAKKVLESELFASEAVQSSDASEESARRVVYDRTFAASAFARRGSLRPLDRKSRAHPQWFSQRRSALGSKFSGKAHSRLRTSSGDSRRRSAEDARSLRSARTPVSPALASSRC
jgi:predicted patatin/cPLA2 family phospholipase